MYSPQDIAQGLNALLGADVCAAIDAGTVGTDAIRQGIVYRRSALAQPFVDADGEVATVVVNHLKSKGSSGLAATTCVTEPAYEDCDQGDGQGFFNGIRTRHAQELVDWLATDPTGTTDDDVLLLGDYNAYAMEDPIDVLRGAGPHVRPRPRRRRPHPGLRHRRPGRRRPAVPTEPQAGRVVVEGDGGDAVVLGATSSEADSGLGADDVPNDIGSPDGGSIPLRAERCSEGGPDLHGQRRGEQRRPGPLPRRGGRGTALGPPLSGPPVTSTP